jgi:hypothetical protein
MTTSRGPVPEPDSDHRELLNELASLRANTAPPPALTELARQAFQFRSLDAEVAALVDGPDGPAGPQAGALSVRRAAPSDRRLVFEPFDGRLSMELTVTASAGRFRLEGHVLPSGAMTVELRRGSSPAPVPVDADPWGGFVVEGLEPGPIRVTCRRSGERPVTSEWFLLG